MAVLRSKPLGISGILLGDSLIRYGERVSPLRSPQSFRDELHAKGIEIM